MAAKKVEESAFRTRDLLAIAAAAVAFFFATQSSPDATVHLKWYIPLPSTETASQVRCRQIAEMKIFES
jgi:hypothetical protein